MDKQMFLELINMCIAQWSIEWFTLSFGPPLLLSIRDFKVELWRIQGELDPLVSNITLNNCISELYQATSSNK